MFSLYRRAPPRARGGGGNESELSAERFSGRMGPFSGSDQVSAVVKLSLFGRKNSKHELSERQRRPPGSYGVRRE